MSLIVKICGLSAPETLDVALDAGAEMVGFVFFPPSPRHLALETARELGQQVKRRAVKVALTVDADDATLANIVEVLHPEILQLHGRETVARLRDIKQKFGRQVMKAVAVETAADLASPTASCSMPAPRSKPRVQAVLARYSTGRYWKILI
jgi:phosphoribosylanthranilate isomerase